MSASFLQRAGCAFCHYTQPVCRYCMTWLCRSNLTLHFGGGKGGQVDEWMGARVLRRQRASASNARDPTSAEKPRYLYSSVRQCAVRGSARHQIYDTSRAVLVALSLPLSPSLSLSLYAPAVVFLCRSQEAQAAAQLYLQSRRHRCCLGEGRLLHGGCGRGV